MAHSLNKEGITYLALSITLLAIRHKLRKPSFWEITKKKFISISMFGSFENPFAMITSLFPFLFRRRRFISLVQMKGMISMALVEAAESHGHKGWLDIYDKDICINSNLDQLTKFSNSSRSIILKKSYTENFSINHEDHSKYHRNGHELCSGRGITFWVWRKIIGNWGKNV